MAFDINNFVIDRPLRGTMLHATTDKVLWSITQVEEPSLSISTETADVVDALGTPIATFNRAKTAEFSATSSLFDLGLLAAQSGTEKQHSGADNKIPTPVFKTLVVPAGGGTATLDYAPNDDGIPYIYLLKNDDTLADPVPYAGVAGEDAFTYETTTLTFPTNAVPGARYMAIYDRDADDTHEAVSVVGTGVDFPTAGKFVLEVLGNDVCDPSTKVYAYVIFPNAKLLSDFELSFTSEGKHPFSLRAMVNYCDPLKKLYEIIIPA